ncbi:MAG TPA: PAS domain-containing protein, partial [Candidatus Tectomicrobia bacterium]|nr:PAS domain-containing protein [Candidatus Tectomicrobia bacterium]
MAEAPGTFAGDDFADFFENAAVPLRCIGPDGTILHANRAELELLGYAREEYVGRHIGEFHVDAVALHDLLARLARGETLRDQPARLRRRDGSVRHVLIDSNARREGGRFLYTRCLTRDVTARAAADQRQAAEHAITRRLAEAVTVVEAADDVLGTLLATFGWRRAALWLA